MKERRAQQAAQDGSVLVAEDDEEPEADETPADVLAEDLRQLEAAYEGWHVSLEGIWTLEESGPLDLASFSRKSWLEYQMVQNLQAQERLRPQLEQARTREAVRSAQAQHDALVPIVTARAEAVVDALATLTEALAALREGFGLASGRPGALPGCQRPASH
jgi:deferrochelatase/peroxidase EfeB